MAGVAAVGLGLRGLQGLWHLGAHSAPRVTPLGTVALQALAAENLKAGKLGRDSGMKVTHLGGSRS